MFFQTPAVYPAQAFPLRRGFATSHVDSDSTTGFRRGAGTGCHESLYPSVFLRSCEMKRISLSLALVALMTTGASAFEWGSHDVVSLSHHGLFSHAAAYGADCGCAPRCGRPKRCCKPKCHRSRCCKPKCHRSRCCKPKCRRTRCCKPKCHRTRCCKPRRERTCGCAARPTCGCGAVEGGSPAPADPAPAAPAKPAPETKA